jgi:heme/copper-type cytochrome/quinol oxidase subunit 2
VNKKLFTYLLLSCVVAWLVFSYVPATQQMLPAIGYSTEWFSLLLWLGGISALVFLAIQIWLVGSTLQALRQQRPIQSRLNLSKEVLWTALPILMTAFLIIVGYQIWDAL